MAKRPKNLFPLIRHISTRLTPILARTYLTPNMITLLSLVLGLAAGGLFATGQYEHGIWGAVFLTGNYVLDNCDGEIARLKNLGSDFGDRFDSFVDWIVHLAFFAGLGYGCAQRTDSDIWLVLGLIGALGGTINYTVGFWLKARMTGTNSAPQPEEEGMPENLKDRLIFIFRELFRADFFAIVLLLAVIDQTWLLLPTAAIGAHAYWITQIVARDKNYHV